MADDSLSLIRQLDSDPQRAARRAQRKAERQAARKAERIAARKAERNPNKLTPGAARTQAAAPAASKAPTSYPSDESVSSSEIAAIASLVSARIGQTVTHTHTEPVAVKKGLGKNRRYYRHVFTTAGQKDELPVFTKLVPNARLEQIEKFLATVVTAEFRVPTFYGTVPTGQGPIGAWEFVTGRTLNLAQMSRDDLVLLTRAVAAINALTPEVRRQMPDLPVGTKLVHPAAKPLRESLQTRASGEKLDEHTLRALDQLDALEPKALKRFSAIGDLFFSHQDIASGNLLVVPPNDQLVILDWETASMGAPGTSLQRLAVGPIELQQQAVEIYVEHMRDRGYRLDPADVLFVIGAAHVFRSLNWGLRRLPDAPERAMKSIKWGLKHVSRYFGPA